jgi:hypothetical protein
MTPGGFQVNDLRGEAWLYTEGKLRVNVGVGMGIAGHCGVHSDVNLESDCPLDADKVAHILAQLLVFMGTEGGFGSLGLTDDGEHKLTPVHFESIDHQLGVAGFHRLSSQDDEERRWVKCSTVSSRVD